MAKKNQKRISLILIIFSLLLSIFVAYTYFSKTSIFTKKISIPESLLSVEAQKMIGIWQASGGMAAGWADRYHFYSDGKYRFYPNQMIKSDKKEKIGIWRIENNKLILDNDSFLFIPPEIKGQDFYPSTKIGSVQFWQYSKDPSRYGDEFFPQE